MGSSPLLFAAREYLWLQTDPGSPPRRIALPWSREVDPQAAARAWRALLDGRPWKGGLAGISAELPGPSEAGLRVGDAAARAVVESLGRPAVDAPTREVAEARRQLPPEVWRPDRERLLAFAEESLRTLLSSPAEIIITLSREEDRFERLIRREREALTALEAGSSPDTVVALYAKGSEAHLAALEERRRGLDRAVEEATLRLLPNTSAVVGPRTAARLLAIAGSPRALLRLNASQVQIAGAGRRKPGSPGPRHGVLYRAEGMDRVRPDRRGALARSLASWTTVALRADLLTQGSVGSELARRRAARVETLSKGRLRPRFPKEAPAPAPPPRPPARPPRRTPPARPGARRQDRRGPPRPRRDGPWKSRRRPR
jgi:hypothetical protein